MSQFQGIVKEYHNGGFYWERKLYQSEAFLSLSKNSIKVVIALLDGRIRSPSGTDKKGSKTNPVFINLNSLILPYSILEKTYKISRSKIPDALDQVLERGFITIVHHGGMFDHDKSVYAWSDKWMHWTPGTVFFERKKERIKRGYQAHGE